MKRTKQLPSIHYSESLLTDFLTQMREFSDVNTFEIKVRWGNGDSATYNDLNNLFEDTNIPDRISKFRATLYADEGRISLNADSYAGGEVHSVTVDGEREWVHSNINAIQEFAEQRSGLFGRIFRKKWTRRIQAVLFGFLGSYIGGYIIGLIIPFYHPAPLPVEQIVIAFLLVLSVLSLEFVNSIYPFVILRRRGKEPMYKKATVAISFLLTLISTVAALISILNG